MIVFNSTAQHAAVNFGQFETYQFIPNNPASMRLPVHKKGEVCSIVLGFEFTFSYPKKSFCTIQTV